MTAEMRVGYLDLRRTEDGWQYRQGDDGGQWREAGDVLGPLAGAGINGLLDELFAARELAGQSARASCSNCRYWRYDRTCDFIDSLQGERVADSTGCQIIVVVHDDSGLSASLKTGPGFSCPSFSRKSDTATAA